MKDLLIVKSDCGHRDDRRMSGTGEFSSFFLLKAWLGVSSWDATIVLLMYLLVFLESVSSDVARPAELRAAVRNFVQSNNRRKAGY